MSAGWMVYRTELRRSPLRWAFPLLVALELAVLFGGDGEWAGSWPQASAAAQAPLLFVAPLLAGGTAWAVVRARRGRIVELRYASARRGWQQEAVQCAAHLSYGLAVYGVSAAAVVAVSAPRAGSGFLWPGYLLLGVSVVVGSVAVGQLAGRWFDSAYTVPALCVLGWYLVLAWPGSAQEYRFTQVDGPPQLTVVPEAVAVRLALALALAVLAVLAPPLLRGARRWRRPTRWRVVTFVPVAGVVLCAAAVPATGETRTARTPPERPVCSEGAPRVCLWPEDSQHLDELGAAVRRLGAIPHDWIFVPGTFYEEGLRNQPPYDAADFRIVGGRLDAAVRQMVSLTFTESTGSHGCLPTADAEGRLSERASRELRVWLQLRALGAGAETGDVRVGGGTSAADVRRVREVVRRSEASQLAWVRWRLDTFRAGLDCDPAAGAAPRR